MLAAFIKISSNEGLISFFLTLSGENLALLKIRFLEEQREASVVGDEDEYVRSMLELCEEVKSLLERAESKQSAASARGSMADGSNGGGEPSSEEEWGSHSRRTVK